MRHIHLLCVTLLLCNKYLSVSASTSIVPGLPSKNSIKLYDDEFQRNMTNENGREKLKFTELNIDVIYHIFEELNLKDLLNLRKISETFSSIIDHTMRQKYTNYRLKIVSQDSKHMKQFFENKSFRRIEIYSVQAAKELLQLFRHTITIIELENFRFPKNESNVISKLLNEYYCGSLIKFRFGWAHDDTLQQFTVPFEAVENVTFGKIQSGYKTGIFQLNQLFPKLKQMRVLLSGTIDYTFIDCKFSHLKDLNFMVVNDDWKRNEMFERFLQKNEQIRRLETSKFPNGSFETIAHFLPHIEHLVVTWFENSNHSISLTNLKHLVLYAPSSSPLQLTYPALETLMIYYWPGLYSDSIDFFKRHSNLKRLYLHEYYDDIKVPFVELTKELNNLIEMSVETSTTVQIEDIIVFMESHGSVMKFQFSVFHYKQEDLQRLRERFTNEWYIENYSRVGLSFERINK